MRFVGVLAFVIGSMILGASDAHASHTEGCPDAIVETFGDRAHKACNVSLCESGWAPGATSPVFYYQGLYVQYIGLFQIDVNHGAGASYNPWINAQWAYKTSGGGYNWGQWPVCGLR